MPLPLLIVPRAVDVNVKVGYFFCHVFVLCEIVSDVRILLSCLLLTIGKVGENE